MGELKKLLKEYKECRDRLIKKYPSTRDMLRATLNDDDFREDYFELVSIASQVMGAIKVLKLPIGDAVELLSDYDMGLEDLPSFP